MKISIYKYLFLCILFVSTSAITSIHIDNLCKEANAISCNTKIQATSLYQDISESIGPNLFEHQFFFSE